MRERIPGFYWVKCRLVWHGPPMKVEDIWEVAKWEYGRWYRADDSVATFSDDYFLQINEKRLEYEDIASKRKNIKDNPKDGHEWDRVPEFVSAGKQTPTK